MYLESKKVQAIVQGRAQSVKVNFGDLQTALRIWKKQQKDLNISEILLENRNFKSKSLKRKETLSLARYNQQKESDNAKILNNSK